MWRVIALVTLLTAAALAQAPSADMAKVVAQQFGPAFTIAPGFAAMTGDLDGDGAEDLAIVATSRDPLTDQLDFHFKVLDPFNSHFGIGDPKITMQMTALDGSVPRVILVVHDWRAAAPKAKFVLVNVPFDRVAIARKLVKKKVVNALRCEEISGVATVYWTGKKYKWDAQ